jgi:iron-sulfur cluster assembly protein
VQDRRHAPATRLEHRLRKGDPMITITPQAAEQIRKAAQDAGVNDVYLRLAARLADKGEIEYGMGFDDKAEGDVQFETNDIRVLVAPGCVELLTGATLDYVEINPGEQRFIFINPNDPSHKPPQPGV